MVTNAGSRVRQWVVGSTEGRGGRYVRCRRWDSRNGWWRISCRLNWIRNGSSGRVTRSGTQTLTFLEEGCGNVVDGILDEQEGGG